MNARQEGGGGRRAREARRNGAVVLPRAQSGQGGDEEAGADPGPACDGRGGDLPTITDAHIIQGTIRPDAFLGGAMSIDEQASPPTSGSRIRPSAT